MPLSDFYLVVQIAPYDQLQMIERLVDVPQPTPAQTWYCYYYLLDLKLNCMDCINSFMRIMQVSSVFSSAAGIIASCED